MTIYDYTTFLYLFSFVDLMMTQDLLKYVGIL
jgi:hypothetical protein